MTTKTEAVPDLEARVDGGMAKKSRTLPEKAISRQRDFLDSRLVYLAITPRARGLTIGLNLNPDKHCNFDCAYCEVDRGAPGPAPELDLEAMTNELQRLLGCVYSGEIRRLPGYSQLPEELLKLRHVALSGDGEPTLCPCFADAVRSVVHVRAQGKFPFFKIVLITNATAFDSIPVQSGLELLTRQDEVWAKLDAGTQAFMDRINRSPIPLEKVLANLLLLGRQRPLVIQSLFARLNGAEPSADEIEAYSWRLKELITAGASISLVQIYSATRPIAHPSRCEHLRLPSLSRIAQIVRDITGLKVEVF
jgi:wyosine [tRNA(Phe)-imidazoG37] synthetase (radical SAM superfamily)